MNRKRPSGDSTIASGKLPTCRCCPAGAIFQPFGSSVTPPPSVPGQSGGISPKLVRGSATSAARTNDATNDRVRIPASCTLDDVVVGHTSKDRAGAYEPDATVP